MDIRTTYCKYMAEKELEKDYGWQEIVGMGYMVPVWLVIVPIAMLLILISLPLWGIALLRAWIEGKR